MASTASASRAAAARPTVQLHVRQAQAHDALASAYLRGVRRAMVVLPTGVGKTVTALAAPRALRLARAGTVRRMLFIAHRKPLLRQAMKTAAWVEPGAVCHLLSDRSTSAQIAAAHIVFAMVQRAGSRRGLESLPLQHFDFIVIDEAHHACTDSGYHRILAYLGADGRSGPLVLGLTATAVRPDGASLTDCFDEVVYEMTLRDAMLEGLLTEAYYRPVSIGVDLLTAVRPGRPEFSPTRLASAMNVPDITACMVAAYLALREEIRVKHGALPRTLAFCTNRSHAADVAAALTAAGVTTGIVTGETEDVDGELARFAAGAYEVAVSVDLLLEGFDDPGVSVAIDLKPTRSFLLAAQELGRILRLQRGKTAAYYLQALPMHAADAGMVTVPQLFDVTPVWAESDGGRRAVSDGPVHEAGGRAALADAAERLSALFDDPDQAGGAGDIDEGPLTDEARRDGCQPSELEPF